MVWSLGQMDCGEGISGKAPAAEHSPRPRKPGSLEGSEPGFKARGKHRCPAPASLSRALGGLSGEDL